MVRVKQPGQPPKVWQQLEKVGKDGKSLKFTIQEIPEDRYEEAIQHMRTYFVAEEPTCECWSKFRLTNTYIHIILLYHFHQIFHILQT